jgi:hypothetical protein
VRLAARHRIDSRHGSTLPEISLDIELIDAPAGAD